MKIGTVRVTAACVAAAALLGPFGLVPAHAKGSAPAPPAQSPQVGVAIANGDVGAGVNIEPGPAVDSIIGLANALGVKGVGVRVPPNGLLPAANVGVGATGSVSANASVSSCPADHVCFWDQHNFTGKKLVLGSPYAESKGGGCANLPEGFRPLSAMSRLRNDRKVARRPNVTGGEVQYGIGLNLERCHANLPHPDHDLPPDGSIAAIHPNPGVVSYSDFATTPDSGGGCDDEFC